ncbi:MAG: sulfite oxidase-like oxidoreductase [Pseudanabaena sp.]|jgi:DMSO/TMAO reductase YedYZ molybdopterin-dependent catalytic subunit|nr:sulfite oxidase-like oxidoreductase [Chitinophagaceae bacterium]MCA6503586.1 sulfite oxidase-like oxidoreductase [Pseudanabaena sp. M090S1SP2A07QC]MCA6505424.1 sulfite oxidase-like oxidoreductase [Pseudanabaena sp. M172S2SP2A07QC]MCA6523283.1 sulfite oxidase-like oxidoreductase [Pseudanabaena sp. M051S1SP2A07QC]MCA6526064.1 sulfite oxidase-like oxidoreductase [Pseudanabaena sp. M179S2SP2A07QC]MCA6528984.1 sulfite oxidase-like oxidoreductase [Pseudanabaena sp. M125S2SP2A07QC]MCA6535326.1 su
MFGSLFQSRSPNQDRIPKGQRLTNGFPIMTYGDTPQIQRQDWQFRVWGLATEKIFSWDDFMSMPQTEFTIDFHCVTTWSKLDVKWKGIKVTDFLKYIEVDPQAVHLMEHCYGGYTTNIAMEDFAREENFFAHTLFDAPLPIDNGGPMRLVVPHLYAWKSAKWLNGLEFLDKMQLGFWERNGYHHRGEPFAEERYSSL